MLVLFDHGTLPGMARRCLRAMWRRKQRRMAGTGWILRVFASRWGALQTESTGLQNGSTLRLLSGNEWCIVR